MEQKIHNIIALKQNRKELRSNLTPAEAALWKILKNSQIEGKKFRRQHSVGPYILDFFPSISAELRQALTDPDHEIRGEALVGLAIRKDSTIIPELLNEWRDDDVSILSIEAAEEIHDSRLYHRLKSFTEILTLDDDPYFAGRLADAIEACKPEAEQAVDGNPH